MPENNGMRVRPDGYIVTDEACHSWWQERKDSVSAAEVPRSPEMPVLKAPYASGVNATQLVRLYVEPFDGEDLDPKESLLGWAQRPFPVCRVLAGLWGEYRGRFPEGTPANFLMLVRAAEWTRSGDMCGASWLEIRAVNAAKVAILLTNQKVNV